MHFCSSVAASVLCAATALAQSVATDKPTYVVGERIEVQFTGSTSATDWVGLFGAGAPQQPSIVWQYTNGQQSGTGAVIGSGSLVFLPVNLTPGQYEARFHANDGYTLLAQATFDVVSESLPPTPFSAGDLTVMSFNVWVNASNGFGGTQRVADVIADSGADIVGLQESDPTTTAQILAALQSKPGYASAQASFVPQNSPAWLGIISRFPITASYTASGLRGFGVKVAVPSVGDVRFFNTHLTAYPYGPYTVRDGQGAAQALADELSTRHPEMVAILAQLVDNPANEPCLVTYLVGDHNCPSHLDWTPANAAQNFGEAIVWPVSMLLVGSGFEDLFRQLHGDPTVVRGLTWSPGYPKGSLSIDDVHDRIDMVYCRPACEGAGVAALDAYTIDQDPWPTDHRAVAVTVVASAAPGRAPTYTYYGNGCSGVAGSPMSTVASLPIGGQSTDLGVTNALAGTLAISVIGLSRTAYAGVALPFDLTSVGAPGCALLASADLTTLTTTDGLGNSSVSFAVPASVVGLEFFTQWFVFDPATNNLGFVVSDAGFGVIGDSTYGVNLIANPGAEDDVGITAGQDQRIARWRDESGSMTSQLYNGFSVDDPSTFGSNPGSAFGNNYFYGGEGWPTNVAAARSIYQDIAVHQIAADIDLQKAQYDLLGSFGGWSNQNDVATLYVRFMDDAGTVLGSTQIGGAVANAAARNNLSGFVPDATQGILPIGTRRIELELESWKDVGGVYGDGSADNLELVLTRLP